MKFDSLARSDVLIIGRTESALVGPVIEIMPGQTTEIGLYYYNPKDDE